MQAQCKEKKFSRDSTSVESVAESTISSSNNNIIAVTNDSSLLTNYNNKINTVFMDDIIFEILQFLESLFIIRVCMKISKQWRQVSFQIPLSLSLAANSFKRVSEPIKRLANCEGLKNLTCLNMYLNGIDDESVKYISTSECLKSLTFLDLGYNLIGNEGVKYLATSAYLKNLTSLYLGHNRFDNEGVKHISTSECLKKLTSFGL